MGRFPDALAEWDIVSGLEPDFVPPAAAADVRSGFESSGPQGYWQAWIDASSSGLRIRHMAFYHVRACAQLGRIDEAFRLLDGLIEERSPWASQLLQDPVFDPLRADPRFGGIRRRMGFGPDDYRAGEGNATGLSAPPADTDATPKK
jgi:hypothetical protein